MADELKDQRVVTMMSPSELEAIDDWMFKNRIRSRGEAIRRLCQTGLGADASFGPLSDSIFDVTTELMNLATKLADDEQAMEILEVAGKCLRTMGRLRGPVISMRQGETAEEALALLAEINTAWEKQDPGRARRLLQHFFNISRKREDSGHPDLP